MNTDSGPGQGVSVVIPVYNSQETIGSLVDGLLSAFARQGRLQIVLVNDGSRDASDAVCRSLARKHPEDITYLRLSRNFGEHNAVMAGLRHAAGSHIVIMDDDLQNSPEDAARLHTEALAKGFDLLYARYDSKEHPWWRNLGSRFHGWVADLILDKPQGLYLSSFKCISRALAQEILRYAGPFPHIDGLALRATANIGCLEATHRPRSRGHSGYTPGKLLSLWTNMVVNFSVLPLRLSTVLGLILIAAGLGLSLWVVAEKVTGGDPPSGFAFLAVAVLLFSGTQIFMLGILGEYVGKLFLSANHTPQYVIMDTAGYDPSKDHP